MPLEPRQQSSPPPRTSAPLPSAPSAEFEPSPRPIEKRATARYPIGLVDPVRDWLEYQRLGVAFIPSKSSKVGQQAYQLDLFKSP